jgi:hypothetical protein
MKRTNSNQKEARQMEAIIDRKMEGRKLIYLAKWKGTEETSWENKGNVQQSLIDAYEKNLQMEVDDISIISPKKNNRRAANDDSNLGSSFLQESNEKAKKSRVSANSLK